MKMQRLDSLNIRESKSEEANVNGDFSRPVDLVESNDQENAVDPKKLEEEALKQEDESFEKLELEFLTELGLATN